MRFFSKIFVVLALFCAGHALAAEPVAGKDYLLVNPPQPTNSGDKIEVLQFFYYPCSHCFKLDPFLKAWAKKMPKDVALVDESTVFSDSMEPMARTFYALEALRQRERLHDKLFNALHMKNMDLSKEATLTDFVVKNGVDRKKFSEAYNSPLTLAKVARSKQLAVDYAIRGTPTLIVDGRYIIYALSPEKTIQVLNDLVSKVRKERAKK